MSIHLRDATTADYPAILQLNGASVSFLSPMDEARLHYLAGCAAYFRVAEVEGQVAAFLLAMREKAGHDSVNYQWLKRATTSIYM